MSDFSSLKQHSAEQIQRAVFFSVLCAAETQPGIWLLTATLLVQSLTADPEASNPVDSFDDGKQKIRSVTLINDRENYLKG